MKRSIVWIFVVLVVIVAAFYPYEPQRKARLDSYNTGYEDGRSDGYGSGYEEGKTRGYESGYEDGRSDGYNTGYSEGKSNGYEDGYEDGKSAGYDSGFADGHSSGFDEGCEAGYNDGYDDGYSDGRSSVGTSRKSQQSQTVYITRTGDKYHRAGCQYLNESKIPISEDDARAQGYTRCSRCW